MVEEKKMKLRLLGSDNSDNISVKKTTEMIEDAVGFHIAADKLAKVKSGTTNTQTGSQPSSSKEIISFLSGLNDEERKLFLTSLPFLPGNAFSSQSSNQSDNMFNEFIKEWIRERMKKAIQSEKSDEGVNQSAVLKMLELQMKQNTDILSSLMKSKGEDSDKNLQNQIITALLKERETKQDMSSVMKSYLDFANTIRPPSFEKSDEVDRALELLAKMQSTGIVADPKTLFEIEKLRVENSGRRYELDKEDERRRYELDTQIKMENLKADREEKQTERVANYLSGVANTLSDALAPKKVAGSGAVAKVIEKKINEVICPRCSSVMDIDLTKFNGVNRIECTSCKGLMEITKK